MPSYERFRKGMRTPWDAVIVTVRQGSGRTVADVGAVDYIADFPEPVPSALQRAEEVKRQLKLKRVVVLLEEDVIWRDDWGLLSDTCDDA
ncbi:hypothetical protein [Devosia sediminis]|uniref:Uncharacterized protein n=1 Tax=Devosia sediminis TaxID=2798801 RepID=A0A934MJI0_9HYPH|nr:hypothetical protein [Devosia sediminis]MBJ3783090.1 hypothetical protein [Devosia sediminis]